MVVPFGFSVGDFIAGTSTLIECFRAFKAGGGAAENYEEAVTFLQGMQATLIWTETYVEKHPDGTYTTQISDQIARIEKPWKSLEKFLSKFEKGIGKTSSAANPDVRRHFRKVFSTLNWTLKDLAGEVSKLKDAVAKYLHTLNSFLLLQTLWV